MLFQNVRLWLFITINAVMVSVVCHLPILLSEENVLPLLSSRNVCYLFVSVDTFLKCILN